MSHILFNILLEIDPTILSYRKRHAKAAIAILHSLKLLNVNKRALKDSLDKLEDAQRTGNFSDEQC